MRSAPYIDTRALAKWHLDEPRPNFETLVPWTLDALHLAIARDLGTPLIATADRIMAKAAAALGLEVERFD